MADTERALVDFRTEPSKYRHWKLAVEGPIARLAMDVSEDGGLRPGYELKLNSYDLGGAERRERYVWDPTDRSWEDTDWGPSFEPYGVGTSIQEGYRERVLSRAGSAGGS